jgi:carbon storage regulator CsrA
MLVLTRRCGESIVLDGDIRITVVSAKGKAVRLAISAPASVRIDRQEVHDRLVAAAVRKGHAGATTPHTCGGTPAAGSAGLALLQTNPLQ